MSIKDLPNSLLDASKTVIELSELKVAMQIVRGSESKLMPLAKKAGVRFMKPKPGDDEAHVMGDKKSIMKFMLSRGMSKDDVIDSHPELKEESDPKKDRIKQLRAKFNKEIEKAREQIKRIEKQEELADKAGDDKKGFTLSVQRVDLYHKIGHFEDKLDDLRKVAKNLQKESKKLDPVGKADADIDNDGDTDSSDEYLHKRRAAIKKAMKDEGNKFTGALAAAKEKGEKEFVVSGKKYSVQEVEDMEHDKNKKLVKEKDVKETTMMSGKPEKKSVADVRRDMQKSVKDANQKLRDAEQRKKERLRKMATMKEALLPLIEEFGVEMISEIIGNVRVPDAGKDSGGVRKAMGKDDGGSNSSGMDNKEKVGYNALLQIAKKLNKAYNDEMTANSDEAEERAIDQVNKLRNQFQSKAKFYKSSTAQKARADANKAVPQKEKDTGS